MSLEKNKNKNQRAQELRKRYTKYLIFQSIRNQKISPLPLKKIEFALFETLQDDSHCTFVIRFKDGWWPPLVTRRLLTPFPTLSPLKQKGTKRNELFDPTSPSPSPFPIFTSRFASRPFSFFPSRDYGTRRGRRKVEEFEKRRNSVSFVPKCRERAFIVGRWTGK